MAKHLTNKERFKDFSKRYKEQLPFSLQFNWWNEVVKTNWELAMVTKGDQVQAVWPYYLRKKGPWKVIAPAYFTPYAGPWLIYPGGQKPSSRVSYENKLYQALIEQLPKVAEIEQQMPLNLTNGLPFLWNGFQESVGYTYLLDLSLSEAELWSNLRENIRRQIKKAEKTTKVGKTDDSALIEKRFKATFKQQGNAYPIGDDQFIARMLTFMEKNKMGEALTASSADEAHTVLVSLRDAQSAYYLLGAADARYKNSGAMSLLMWKSILAAKEAGCMIYNFEGSVIPSIEKFIRGFGGELCPYRKIYKRSSKSLEIAQRIKG